MNDGLNNFDIGITTFSLRFDFISNLIEQIKQYNISNNIYICINGEYNCVFDQNYRRDILSLCLKYDNLYPIFFVEMRGLSKMWNTLCIHSTKENILILNDDIEINTHEIFYTVSNHINDINYNGLTKINNTFSFFLINKNILDTLGYFDERLLGFGEEDGDITYRYIQHFNKDICNIQINGLNNIVSNIRHKDILPGIGKYSLFNRNFMFKEKYTECNHANSIKGMFDYPCNENLPVAKQYPYEIFHKEQKHKLASS